MIPYGRQEITQDDIDSVVRVLESDFLTQGPVVPQFEQSLADYCSAKYAVAVNSATSALHLACLALGLGEGDCLWTSPVTFVASANCALYCGAEVDFVDIDPHTFNLSVSALEKKLKEAERRGTLPKIVIPVHLSGLSCDMESIRALSKQYGFSVIEDASHAVGGGYKNERIGGCKYSDITIFSFHPVKIITTGEGGAALTNRSELARRMALLRSHGITRDPDHMTQEPDGEWFYQQLELGFNYRMTDIGAALGMSQMDRLDEYVAARHKIAARYDEHMQDLPVVPQFRPDDSYSGMHLYVVRMKLDELAKSHKQAFSALRGAGIGVNLHYIPVHLQPWYAAMGFSRGDFPEAESYYGCAVSLPIFPSLSESQQLYIVEVMRKVLQ